MNDCIGGKGFLNNMIAKDGYIFKVGWKDWRPIEEGYEALGIPNPNQAAPVTQEEYKKQVEKRLEGAPRASINGRVVVHNNGQIVIARVLVDDVCFFSRAFCGPVDRPRGTRDERPAMQLPATKNCR